MEPASSEEFYRLTRSLPSATRQKFSSLFLTAAVRLLEEESALSPQYFIVLGAFLRRLEPFPNRVDSSGALR